VSESMQLMPRPTSTDAMDHGSRRRFHGTIVSHAQTISEPSISAGVAGPRVVTVRVGGRLVVLQQPLNVVELDLRPRRIGQAAAQLFQDPAHPLHIDLAGDHF
jgi:hypothetical protein